MIWILIATLILVPSQPAVAQSLPQAEVVRATPTLDEVAQATRNAEAAEATPGSVGEEVPDVEATPDIEAAGTVEAKIAEATRRARAYNAAIADRGRTTSPQVSGGDTLLLGATAILGFIAGATVTGFIRRRK